MVNKTLKQNTVVDVPVVLQLEALECGAASLTMIMAYFGKWIPLEKVREDCGVSRDGANGKNIVKAARSYGMEASGRLSSVKNIKTEGKFPCIIHWNMNHFVVLCGFRRNYAVINDPAKGRIKVPMEEFDSSYTGICMVIEPGPEFVKGGKKKSVWDLVKERLRDNKKPLLVMVAITTVLSVINMIYPLFTNYYIENVLTGKTGIVDFGFIFIAVMAVQLSVELIKSIYSNKVNGKLASKGSTTFMWKLLNLPVNYFAQRMAGDIQERYTSNANIASSMINKLAPVVLNALSLVLYFIVMLSINSWLAVFGITCVILNIIFSIIASKRRVNITKVKNKAIGKQMATAISGISMIETIKAGGSEESFFERWAGQQAACNTQEVNGDNLNLLFTIIPKIINELTRTVSLFLGMYLLTRGEITIGLLLCFIGLIEAFTKPAMDLINVGQSLQDIKNSMERIDDVMKYPDDELISHVDGSDAPYQKLSGRIELKDITFGYSPLSPPLIENFSLTLTPGKSVAFVGRSGCGKSTLTNMISGLYKQWSGEILYDGKTITEIDKDVFRGSLAVIEQDISIFEDTIANNIKMWDDTIEDFDMILAAKDARIHDDILDRDGGYNHYMVEGGKTLSGGQKQRIEIARALAQDPTIIIMDEATSALDARTEHDVVKAIKDRNITTIVVAHRLSTIRDCDEIIVLDKGKVVERGTHEELIELNGLYTNLVTKE